MKKGFISSVLTLALCLLIGAAAAQTPVPHDKTFDYGIGTWDLPEGIYQITSVEAWGGGGGGGGAQGGADIHSVGISGGGGAYAKATNIAVNSTMTLNYSKGQGGTQGTSSAWGGNGGDSYLEYGGSYYVLAGGGKGGKCKIQGNSNQTYTPSNDNGGLGGVALYGDVKTNGGNAGNSRIFGGAYVDDYSAESGNGGNGANGGNGGAKVQSYSTGWGIHTGHSFDGNSGSTIGGGGSAGVVDCWNTSTTKNGGKGGDGQLIVTYTTLTLTITLNDNHGGTSTFDIPYYNLYGSNLTTPTLANHIFLGWFTQATGGTQVTATDRCLYETNTTLYAHWLDAGEITTTTVNLPTPCYNYTVTNEELATADGQTVTYSWKCQYNSEEVQILNINKSSLTQDDFTLEKVGTYKFTRHAEVSSPDGADDARGTYTIVVEYNSGEVTSNDTTEVYDNAGFVVNASEIVNGEYRWYENGVLMDGQTYQNLTIAAKSLCPGTYVYKREVKVKDCAGTDWKASQDSCKITITINAGSVDAGNVVKNHNYNAFTINGTEVTDGKYQWFCNGEEMTGKNEQNLSIAAAELCADSTYTYTRKVSIKDCAAEAVQSQNAYIVNVKVDSGSIANATVPMKQDHEAFAISGNTIDNVIYQWKCNDVVLEGESNSSLSINAKTLCPDSTYTFTREVKSTTCDNGQWHASLNKYIVPVTVNAGALVEKPNAEVNQSHEAITVEANEVYNGEYRWLCNDEVIAYSNVQNYQIAAASLCPDSTYVFTREARVTSCDKSNWTASDKSFTVIVTMAVGEIAKKDTTVDHDFAALAINGSEVDRAEYRWMCNEEEIAGATEKDYTIAAASLCPDSTYIFTREVKVDCGSCQWHASADTFKVVVNTNAGAIKDTTVETTHEHEALTIVGDEILNASYQWKQNGELISGATAKDYTIPEGTLCPVATYVYTREVRICETANWKVSDGTYTVNVDMYAGAITSKDTTVKHDHIALMIEGEVVTDAVYTWKCNDSVIVGAAAANYEIPAASLCPDSTYTFTREVVLSECPGSAPVVSTNQYKVTVETNTGAITLKDTTVKHDYAPLTIQGDEVDGAVYQWKNGDEVIASANEYSYTIPVNTLCPGNTYTFTREVKVSVCGHTQWLASENVYKVTVEIKAGEIVSKDTTITTIETLNIEGDAVDYVTYQWLKDDNEISGATSQNYDLSATDLCPGITYTYTRQITVENCPSAIAISDNEYKVTISAGAIEAKDTTVDPGYGHNTPVVIAGDNLTGVEFQWYLNDAEYGVTTYNCTIQADQFCTEGEYVFTRKVKGTSCADWMNSDNEFKVKVVARPGEVDTNAVYICGDYTGKQIGSAEDAQGEDIVYGWTYSKNGAAAIAADTNRSSLTTADLQAICADAVDGDIYVFQRYATISCAAPIASEGSVKVYFTQTGGASDTLNAPDMTYRFNYGEDFLWRDSLRIPDLMQNGTPRPLDWVAEIVEPADSKIYPTDMDPMHTTIHWKLVDKCGNVHEKDQDIYFEIPPCGEGHTVTDVDGNEYATVRIGLDCWMAENLKTTNYADGTPIPDIRAYQGHDMYPDSAQNAETFGLLYTWNAAMNNNAAPANDEYVQGVCPDGWALPTSTDFQEMLSINVFTLRTPDYWLVANGTNTTGFSMLPGGRYNDVHDRYENLLGNAYFWSSDAYNDAEVKTYEADCHCYKWVEVINPKTAGLSVRCIQVEYIAPPVLVVTTDSANSLTKNSATLYGNVKSLGEYTEVNAGFKYGTSATELTSIVTKSEAVTATGSYNCDLTGLTANTQYYYKAFAANSNDTVWGAVKNFKTTSMNPCPGAETVTDYDNNSYNTVLIGTQCWMAENLKTTRYSDGTSIALGSSTSTETAYRYYPNNSESNVSTYGYLYNWPAVMGNSSSSESNPSGVQGICPTGWHVPSDAEWTQLTTYVKSQPEYVCEGCSGGDDESMTNCIAKALASTTGWNSSSDNCAVGNNPSANNATVFSAVPAGDYYSNFGSLANFWSATQDQSDHASSRYLDYNGAFVAREVTSMYNGFSVRCVRN